MAPPKAGEVLVHYRAGGVCHSDHHAMVGLFPVPTPIIMGHEGAGIVEEIGPGVTSVKPGDHVVSVWRYSCGACELCLSGRPAICGEGIRMRADGTLSDGTTRFSINGEKVHHFLGRLHVQFPLGDVREIGAQDKRRLFAREGGRW